MSAPGRIICPNCGANNFSTQAACWKCGASLTGGAPAGAPPSRAEARPVMAPRETIDPAIAVWSAVSLAILFPVFAVPVGMVFLMLDDRRRADIGRITLIWGVAASIVHILITGYLLKAGMDEIRSVLPGGRIGATQPGPNDTVPSRDIPPTFGQ